MLLLEETVFRFELDELVKTENSPPRRRERGDKSLILKNSSQRPLRPCGEKRPFSLCGAYGSQ
jgi:hypothetical protein